MKLPAQLFFSLFLVCALSFLACDESEDDSDDIDSKDDDDDPWSEIEVKWFPCSLYEGADDGRAECSSTKMPINWTYTGLGTVTSYAKRMLSQKSESVGQLWLLHGGPGASGVIGLPALMEEFQEAYPEYDAYTIDARGTGYSEFLECPDQESSTSPGGVEISLEEMPDCIDYLEDTHGERLEEFSTTNSAIDLAVYIDATREKEKKTLIWGGSGGTFWAQRYLQLFPDQADGIILEGIVPPDFSIGFQDEFEEKVGLEILRLCTDDPFCANKLPDPETTLANLYDLLDAGHCYMLGMSVELLKLTFDYLSYYYPFRDAIPALIYRLDRCDPGDMDAIVYLFDVLFGTSSSTDKSFSMVLFFNETFSELWDHPQWETNDDFLDYLDEIYEDPLFLHGKGYDRNDRYLLWPKYTDYLDDQWAQTDVPILMLQGKLDPATPYDTAATLKDHYTGANQTFVTFPYGSHNVTNGSPTGSYADETHCAKQLWLDFMEDPTAPLDISCAAQTLPPDFEGTYYGPNLFGTDDYWENDKTKSKGKHPESWPRELQFVRDQIRNRVRFSGLF